MRLSSELLTLGPFRIWYDADANRKAYSQVAIGGPEQCGCIDCKNFIQRRDNFYPSELKQLLQTLGIDYRKEAEVVTYGEPGQPPVVLEGWYNLIGRVESGDDALYNLTPDFQLDVSNGGLLPQTALKGHDLVKLEWRWPPYNLLDE